MRTDLEIHQDIMKVVDEYTGLIGNEQPRYRSYPYPQRLEFLNDNIKTHVLRERGDIALYRQLHEEAGLIKDAVYQIVDWLHGKMQEVAPNPAENCLVISMLVFGDAYVDKLLNQTLKSMMAFGNLPCLAVEKQVVFHLQTTEEGYVCIQGSDIVHRIKALGVRIEYVLIAPAISRLLTSSEINYWMLGASASLALHYAKSLGAAFHHSYPDIVYSEKFFSELLRLSKQHGAILGSGMRSDEHLMLPALAPYTNAVSLTIPHTDLMAHHLNCLHNASWGYLVNNRPNYWLFPQAHVQLWESEDCLHINSPHLMAHWLNYEVIKDLPPRFYMTLDSEMDLICKGEHYYVIGEEDAVYQAELSPPGRQAMHDIYVDVQGVAQTLWQCVTHRDTAKFFFREMRVKINRSIRPLPSNHIPKSHVISLQQYMYNTIMASDPFAGIKLARPRTHLGYIFQ